MRYRRNTGGTIDFISSDEPLDDTRSTASFKRNLALHRFIQDPHDENNTQLLKKFFPFYNLTIKTTDACSITVRMKTDDASRPFASLPFDTQQRVFSLPKSEYNIIKRITTRKFFFFYSHENNEYQVTLDKNTVLDI